MKYFVRMTRPIKFDDFQFRKGVTFEVSASIALEFYHEWCDRQNKATYDGEAYVLFDNGTDIQVHKNALRVHGEDWDDKELFKRRLAGDIGAEKWE